MVVIGAKARAADAGADELRQARDDGGTIDVEAIVEIIPEGDAEFDACFREKSFAIIRGRL